MQVRTAMSSIWSLLPYRSQVAPMHVGDDLVRDNTAPFDGLFEKYFAALNMTLFVQQHVYDLAHLVPGTVQVRPLFVDS